MASNAENVSIWWRHHVFKMIIRQGRSLNVFLGINTIANQKRFLRFDTLNSFILNWVHLWWNAKNWTFIISVWNANVYLTISISFSQFWALECSSAGLGEVQGVILAPIHRHLFPMYSHCNNRRQHSIAPIIFQTTLNIPIKYNSDFPVYIQYPFDPALIIVPEYQVLYN